MTKGLRRLVPILDRLIRSGAFVFVVVLLLHGAASRGGPILTGDTKVFTLMADRIVVEGWSAVFSAEFLLSPKWTRLLYVSVIIVARAVAGEQWPLIMLVLNLLSDALLAVLVVRLTLLLTRSQLAGWAALLLFTGAFEIVFWVRYVLSDTPFALIAFVPFYFLARALGRSDVRPLSAAVSASAATLLALLIRPTGLPVVAVTALGIVWLLALRRPEAAARWRLRWIGAAVILIMIGSMLVHAWIMQDPARWPLRPMQRQISVMAARAATGEVVVSRPATFHEAPRSFAGYVALDLARFIRFFQYVAEGYSRGHNLVNAVYFTPLYVLALLAIIRARGNDASRRAVVLLAAMTILVFAWFHAITILDFNWRYRLPVMPHMIVLAAVGLDRARRLLAADPHGE